MNCNEGDSSNISFSDNDDDDIQLLADITVIDAEQKNYN